jgi:hypothetical protein
MRQNAATLPISAAGGLAQAELSTDRRVSLQPGTEAQ